MNSHFYIYPFHPVRIPKSPLTIVWIYILLNTNVCRVLLSYNTSLVGCAWVLQMQIRCIYDFYISIAYKSSKSIQLL